MQITDNFNRADGALGSDYVNNLFGGTAIVESNKMRGPTSGEGGGGAYAHRVEAFTEDHLARVTIVSITNSTGSYNNGYLGVLVRSSGSGGTYAGYQAACRNDLIEILAFWNAGVNIVTLGSFGGASDGDVIELRAIGASIEFWKNGAFVDTFAENVNIPRAGAPGVAAFTGAAAGMNYQDDFVAEDISAGPPPVTDEFLAVIGGSGVVSVNDASWNAAHDAVAGTIDLGDQALIASFHSAGTYTISRGFFTFDTSAIPDAATLISAVMWVWSTLAFSSDNDGDDFIVVVGPTNQADPEDLDASDYDQCSTVDTPEEVSNRRLISELPQDDWHEFTLDVDVLNLSGFTMLGMREGHDVLDSPVGSGLSCFFAPANAGFDTKEPYLEVTYSVGGVVMTMRLRGMAGGLQRLSGGML